MKFKKDRLPVVFFIIALVGWSLIAVHDFKKPPKEIPPLTEGQKEMLKRAKIIQDVILNGKLKLTPARYFEVLEDGKE